MGIKHPKLRQAIRKTFTDGKNYGRPRYTQTHTSNYKELLQNLAPVTTTYVILHGSFSRNMYKELWKRNKSPGVWRQEMVIDKWKPRQKESLGHYQSVSGQIGRVRPSQSQKSMGNIVNVLKCSVRGWSFSQQKKKLMLKGQSKNSAHTVTKPGFYSQMSSVTANTSAHVICIYGLLVWTETPVVEPETLFCLKQEH